LDLTLTQGGALRAGPGLQYVALSGPKTSSA